MTCDIQKVGLDSHISASVSLPKMWSFVRKPGSESEFFICFGFVFVCCFFILSRALHFFPFIYVSELSNKLHIEIYLNIIVNGQKGLGYLTGGFLAYELPLSALQTFPVVNSQFVFVMSTE